MIYLDNAAGTRPYPEVIETVADVLTNWWGNASTDNTFGRYAMSLIEGSTYRVAEDISCEPDEIIWTSGACEANSLAINGFLGLHDLEYYLMTTKLEHTSIKNIADDRYHIYADLINGGYVDADKLWKFIILWNDDKPFISINAASSETGVIQNIQEIAEIVHQWNGIIHVDATQLYPWQRINVKALDIDMMSVSGQKLHAPKGIGFLYVRNGIELKPLIYGSQQDGQRGGTYPTHLIAAFGRALELTRKRNTSNEVKLLRDFMVAELMQIDRIHFNMPQNCLPNIISATIDGVDAEALVTMCDMFGVVIAKGSACKSYEKKPSEALLAIGLTPEQALSTIRISLDEFNTKEEIKKASDIIIKMVRRLRNNE